MDLEPFSLDCSLLLLLVTSHREEDLGLALSGLAAVVAAVRHSGRLQEQRRGQLLLLGEQSKHYLSAFILPGIWENVIFGK